MSARDILYNLGLDFVVKYVKQANYTRVNLLLSYELCLGNASFDEMLSLIKIFINPFKFEFTWKVITFKDSPKLLCNKLSVK